MFCFVRSSPFFHKHFQFKKYMFENRYKKKSARFYFCLGDIFANPVKVREKMFTTIEQIEKLNHMLNSAEELCLPVRYHFSMVSALAFKQLNTFMVRLKLLEPRPLLKKHSHSTLLNAGNASVDISVPLCSCRPSSKLTGDVPKTKAK